MFNLRLAQNSFHFNLTCNNPVAVHLRVCLIAIVSINRNPLKVCIPWDKLSALCPSRISFKLIVNIIGVFNLCPYCIFTPMKLPVFSSLSDMLNIRSDIIQMPARAIGKRTKLRLNMFSVLCKLAFLCIKPDTNRNNLVCINIQRIKITILNSK